MPTKRPLLATAADQKRYVEAGARAVARDAALKHRNTLVAGEPGSGKTSLLNHIAFSAQGADADCVLVQARLAEGSRELIDLLLAEAEDAGWIAKETSPAGDDPLRAARQIRRLHDAPHSAIVLMDDPTSEQARTLFGQLRDELWQTPVRFVVTVTPAVFQTLQQPPMDAFFDTTVVLDAFSPAESEELFVRLQDLGEVVPVLKRPEYPIMPRALVAIAAGEALQSNFNPFIRADRVAEAERTAGRPGKALVEAIWSRGAVSASDEDVQRSLGMSRTRLTELLRKLEEVGVLHSFPDHQGQGLGRPRTLYQVSADD
jgi:energy-coupling factor transporter ATP-binding protein EcfA2